MVSLIHSKKAAGPVIIALLVIVIVLLVYIVSSRVQRECTKDTDCGDEHYCGSDFKCHEQKIIEKTEIHNYNLLVPSIILALGIILAAIVLRSKRLERLLNI